MRKLITLSAFTFLFSGVAFAFAAEVTKTGEGKCAKCALKETDKCQNVVVVNEDGKDVTYYLADNKVAKDYHKNVCTKTTKTTVTGDLEEKDGKKVITASKIEKAK